MQSPTWMVVISQQAIKLPATGMFLLCSMYFTDNKEMRTDNSICQFSPVGGGS